MTGFGAASCEAGGARIEVESRSVNHRGLHVKLRLPSELSALEPELDALVRTRFARGTIGLSFAVRESTGVGSRGALDEELLAAYIASARAAARQVGLAEPTELAPFLALPGVAGASALPPERVEERCAAARRAAGEALRALEESRLREGAALRADLAARSSAIAASVERIAARAPLAVEAWRERLARRLRELFGESPGVPREEDLLREAALFAERSDIAEELTRLRAHLAHFEELLREREPVGRKLDFLLQEMHRESNTIGAKASDLEIAREVVDLRTEVDRLKEQVQNVE